MITKTREKRMCEMVGAPLMSPKDKINLLAFHKYSIDPTNKRLIAGLVRDLVTLLQNSTKHNLLTTQMDNGKHVSLVHIPKSVDEAAMYRHDINIKWVKHLLSGLGPQKRIKTPMSVLLNDEDESNIALSIAQIQKEREREEQEWSNEEYTARHLIGHIGENIPKAFRWAVEQHFLGVGNPIVDEVGTFTMLSDANVNYTQANIVARHLRVWFGKPILSSTSKLKKQLTNNNPCQFVKPKCGTQRFSRTNEVVDWNMRDPVRLLLFFLDGVFNRRKAQLRWNSVDIVILCDHGKGFSHAHAVFIFRRRDETTGEWSEYTDSYSIAQAKCNKDTYDILHNTLMPKLNAELESIQQNGGFDVWLQKPPINDSALGGDEFNDDDGDDDCDDALKSPIYTSLLGLPPENSGDKLLYGNIPVQLFSTGDLAQLMTNCGLEGMGTYWCCYCNLPRDKWQQKGHCKGTAWMLSQLASQVELNKL